MLVSGWMASRTFRIRGRAQVMGATQRAEIDYAVEIAALQRCPTHASVALQGYLGVPQSWPR